MFDNGQKDYTKITKIAKEYGFKPAVTEGFYIHNDIVVDLTASGETSKAVCQNIIAQVINYKIKE